MDLESYRKGRKLTQAQFAAALGLRSKSYISGIERGRISCPIKLALKIERWSHGEVSAASLNADAADLLPSAPEAPR